MALLSPPIVLCRICAREPQTPWHEPALRQLEEPLGGEREQLLHAVCRVGDGVADERQRRGEPDTCSRADLRAQHTLGPLLLNHISVQVGFQLFWFHGKGFRIGFVNPYYLKISVLYRNKIRY